MAAGTEVQALRIEFASNLAKTTLPILKKQVADLLTLERRAAETRDYDAAIAANEERKKLEVIISEQEKLGFLSAAQAPASTDKQAARTVLNLKDAQLDHVRLDSAANVLTDWSVPGASATWKLPGLPAGGYEIVLKYESGVMEGGSIVVEEKFFTLGAGLQTTLNGPLVHRLGVLRIRDGDGVFKLTAKTVLKGNLMRLQSVELLSVNRTTDD